MKDKQLSNLIAAPFSGCLSSLFILPFMMLYAWLLQANYAYIAQPLAALHSMSLPDIPFCQWMGIVVLLGVFKLLIAPIKKPAGVDDAIVRFGTMITFCILPYLINWIFL